jgi:4,5-DOPA dioxygenase extradiol
MDYSRSMDEHFAVGRQLRVLRDHGVLILGSGNVVHNLRAIQPAAPAEQAYDWTIAFDQWTGDHISQGRLEALKDFQALGQVAQLAHPTFEHYLPLLYAAGAAYEDETTRFFNTSYQLASLAMRSVIWG